MQTFYAYIEDFVQISAQKNGSWKLCIEVLWYNSPNVMLGFGREGTSTFTMEDLEDLEASGTAGFEALVLTAAVLIQTETPF